MKYFNYNRECMPRAELEELQLDRLRRQVNSAYINVPMYRERFDRIGLRPDDINSLADLARIPFTVKDDFREQYPYGMFAVPFSDIVRIHASSGTTGKPVVNGYTNQDIANWGECMARTLCGGGTDSCDVVHVSYGYGLFTGGLGAHEGSHRLGCTTLPVSSGNTKRQIQLIQDFGSTVICCTPSYLLQIIETAAAMGIDPRTLPVKRAFLGAEPWTKAMREDIEKKLDCKAYDIYGMTELMGPGVAFECTEQDGLHVNEDMFIPEIIDPKTGEVLPEGEKGELVFTCINSRAIPLLRYRTRDITSLTREECGCGRTLARIKRLMGRTDDMLIIRGVNVFPTQIETVLVNVEGIEPQYQIILDRDGSVLDNLEIRVEVSSDIPFDEIKVLEKLQKKLQSELHSAIGLNPKITLVEPFTLERSAGKAKRVIDRRDLYGK
ncbi:MAG: phenylacetate--CoA ligase [Abditibacteriota bacterium]|nr:phenylacetate--CoA ligase [Abditibacteriota bacterium]